MSSEDLNDSKPAEPKKNKEDKEKMTFSSLWAKTNRSFREHKAEFDKISWPNRKDLTSKTLTVIVTSLMFGVIVFGLDSIYQLVFQFIINLVS